ncbi:unnamed protein product [Prorocentrum cordatum]|uniref:Hydroxyproline O-arabinosyltransferase-like domain-containing protein n=1 Tax=Prorocentrum cordatum TaxID=2364126 RepID=A0ABN9V292_9DINO|nr:unnamed protein product [Polarella glacialis]
MVRHAGLLATLPAAGALVARTPSLDAANDLPRAKDCLPADEDMHIVFSTGCNAYQHWQAEVLLNSAWHQGQCGNVTRIVVGCEKKVVERIRAHPGGAADELIAEGDLKKSTFPGLKVHVAPAIAEAEEFAWFNKPWSFKHWLDSQSDAIAERAVVILDPDEFFLQPLTQRAEHADDSPFEIINGYPEQLKHQVTDVAQPGWGVAQKYGFGPEILRKFDQRTICPSGAASPCANMTSEEAKQYYPAGPPYILHNTDFKKVMPTWLELMKPVYEQDRGDVQADMYAYVYAAAHHGVRHVALENYMVSNVEGLGEAWRWVDSLASMSCHDPERALAGRKRPGFIHAAGRYRACTGGHRVGHGAEGCPHGSELWDFHKSHVPSTILGCDDPLLAPPPDELFNAQAAARNSHGKRSAFMICHLTFMINRAALDYKKRFCKAGFNASKRTRLVGARGTGGGVR